MLAGLGQTEAQAYREKKEIRTGSRTVAGGKKGEQIKSKREMV